MSSRPQLAYVANMRLPSEKAHSVHVMEMCAALGKRADVTLLVPNRHTAVEAPDVYTWYGVASTFSIERLPTWDVFRLPVLRRLAFYLHGWTFGRAVTRWAKAHSPDTLFVCRDLYAAYRLAKMGRRVAYEVHDMPEQRVRMFLAKIPLIVTTNQAKRDRLVADFGIPEARILVASNAVDAEQFTGVTAASIREETPVPADALLAVYVGHLYAWKGVDTLAASMQYLPEAHAVLVGGLPEDTARLASAIEAAHLSDRVHLVPQRAHADVPGVLAAADVLVLPTSGKTPQAEETSPIKAFEYLAVGKPIVVADVPSSRQIFTEEAAIFFKPDDAADCARAIAEAGALARDPAQWEHMRAAQQAFIQQHTWDARAQRILSFLLS